MDETGKTKRYLKGCLMVLAAASAFAGIFAHGWNPVWGIVFLLFYSAVLAVTADIFHCRMAVLLLIPYVNIAAGAVMFHRLRGGVFSAVHFLLFAAAVMWMWLRPGSVPVGVLTTLLPLAMIPVVGRISPLPRRGALFGFSPAGRLMAALPLAVVFLLLPLWGYRAWKLHEFGMTLEDLENRPLPPKPHAADRVGALPLEELVRIGNFGMNRTWSEKEIEPIDIIQEQLLELLMAPAMASQPDKWMICSRGVQHWFDQDFRLRTVYREQLEMLGRNLAGLSDETLRSHAAWAAEQERSMPEFNELRARVEFAFTISDRVNYRFLLRKLFIRSVLYVPIIGTCVNDMPHARTEYCRLRPVLEARRKACAGPSAAGMIAEYSLLEKYAYRLAEDLAHLRAGRTAAAVELYRRANGGYPQNLEQLAPEYLDAVPRDPYTGEALKYVPGQCIYSVGRNERDDGGVGRFETRTPDYDIICRLDRK